MAWSAYVSVLPDTMASCEPPRVNRVPVTAMMSEEACQARSPRALDEGSREVGRTWAASVRRADVDRRDCAEWLPEESNASTE